jgi:iron complex transport system permease protein
VDAEAQEHDLVAPRAVAPSRLGVVHLLVGVLVLAGAFVAAILVGPADLPPGEVLRELVSEIPLIGVHNNLPAIDHAIIWQIRAPRVVLAGIVGGTLAVSGASYQGVFQNPLADPYLLGVAAGAGLGATIAIVATQHAGALAFNPLPISAFAGALVAVAATYALSRSAGRLRSATTLILAGVAVGSFLTAVQTYVQQRSSTTLDAVYSWILGGVSTASWSQVLLILPYVGVAGAILIGARRLFDVMSVGDEEATSLGIRASHVRLVTIIAATLGTAAVVSVSGLIGFVGIIVPHAIRFVFGPSYRQILPLAALVGAAFLILADLLARTILSPAEIPLGVVTAFVGAPFFLLVLRQGRSG